MAAGRLQDNLPHLRHGSWICLLSQGILENPVVRGKLPFELFPLRLTFAASKPLRFERGLAANAVRGALGSVADKHNALYRTFFSGARSAPFVLRVRQLEGKEIGAGEEFEIGINLFLRDSADYIVETTQRWEHTGIGPERIPVRLIAVTGREPLAFEFERETGMQKKCLRVDFKTPTELKSGGAIAEVPEFPVLYARLRDRASRLRALYGEGTLPRDEQGAEMARAVKTMRSDLAYVSASRYSSRTGQRHPLGGFTGAVEYANVAAELMPMVELGQWVGVGRQTSWGKGEFTVERIL